MKKIMFLFALMMVAVGLAAQDVEPPTDIFDAAANFQMYMATLGGVAVLSLFLTGLVNGIFQILKSWVRLTVSWLIPVILTFVAGGLLNIGFLAEAPWWLTILYGLGAGLIANRGYDAKTIQNVILFLETLLGNKTVKA